MAMTTSSSEVFPALSPNVSLRAMGLRPLKEDFY